MVEWTDIINQVLDEQAQPVMMKRPANENIEKLTPGGGGGYSGGRNPTLMREQFYGKEYAKQFDPKAKAPMPHSYRGRDDPYVSTGVTPTNQTAIISGVNGPFVKMNNNRRLHSVHSED